MEAEHEIAAFLDKLLDSLSERVERRRRVLACILMGLTNKEMVDVLSLETENQVKKEVRRVLKSIGVTNRTAVVRAYLERAGVIEEVRAVTHLP